MPGGLRGRRCGALTHAVKPKTIIPAFCDRFHLAGLARALALARVTMDLAVEL